MHFPEVKLTSEDQWPTPANIKSIFLFFKKEKFCPSFCYGSPVGVSLLWWTGSDCPEEGCSLRSRFWSQLSPMPQETAAAPSLPMCQVNDLFSATVTPTKLKHCPISAICLHKVLWVSCSSWTLYSSTRFSTPRNSKDNFLPFLLPSLSFLPTFTVKC